MIRIDRNVWNSTQVYGDFVSFEPGWYPCVILGVKEGQTPWGTESVTFNFDIIDGKFVRYFEKDFKSQTGPDKKWRGTLEQSIDERGLPYFKGMITAIEESNDGFKWDFEEASLKGKKVAIGFRKEWYERDGVDKYAVKAFAFRDIKKLLNGELEPPKDKPKKGGVIPAVVADNHGPSMIPGIVAPAPAQTASAPNWEPISDEEELPF